MFLRVIFDTFTPTSPEWIRRGKEVLQYRRKHVMLTKADAARSAALLVRVQGNEQQADRFGPELDTAKLAPSVSADGAARLRRLFKQLDRDQSGPLDILEAIVLLQQIGLGDTDFDAAFAAMDGDSSSIHEEFERWAADKGSQMNLELLDGLHIPGKSLIAV